VAKLSAALKWLEERFVVSQHVSHQFLALDDA
jgi:hypothetical protein